MALLQQACSVPSTAASGLAGDPVPEPRFSSVSFLTSLLTTALLELAPWETDSEMEVCMLEVYW